MVGPDMMHDGGGALSEMTRAGSADYRGVELALEHLERARRRAVDLDWDKFNAAPEDIKAEVRPVPTDLSRTALNQVRGRLDEHFAPHQRVPDRLEADAERWSHEAHGVSDIRRRVAELRSKTGQWSGPAQQMFSTAAEVQAHALDELGGVMIGAAEGCHAGALLQRVVFFIAAREIRNAAYSIDMASGGGENEFFQRRTYAYTRMSRLLEVLDLIRVLSNVREAANEVSQQLLDCLASPNLLGEGSWPTGTSLAGVEAGDPASAVEPDHEGGTDFTAPVPAPPVEPRPGEPF